MSHLPGNNPKSGTFCAKHVINGHCSFLTQIGTYIESSYLLSLVVFIFCFFFTMLGNTPQNSINTLVHHTDQSWCIRFKRWQMAVSSQCKNHISCRDVRMFSQSEEKKLFVSLHPSSAPLLV